MKMSTNDPRYKMPKEKRKFGGHFYTYMEWARTKAEAENRADWYWRTKIGCIGAVTAPFNKGYSVYARFKNTKKGRR